ncbi:hypothetical protein B296_00041155 [Ensete ventricosum]|uniref:Uncharacterized protein n=1 Tax=Ensete ventricosum TaxID=4639 RepID=A0A426YLN6_ENSVE|nr:hypothetical protein B296_00041155 [Ensete ventricosum]
MVKGCIIVEATTNSSTKPLLLSRALYTRILSHVVDKFRSVWSYLRWMYIDQSDAKHIMVHWSLFLLGIFILIASDFVLSYALINRTYDVVDFSLTNASDLSYLCLSVFIHRYDLHHFLFHDKIDIF